MRQRKMNLGQENGLPLLRELEQEAETKRKQVEQLQETLSGLQAQLAALKGEVPLVGELPWYQRYWKYLAAGGVGTIIAGIAIAKKKKK